MIAFTEKKEPECCCDGGTATACPRHNTSTCLPSDGIVVDEWSGMNRKERRKINAALRKVRKKGNKHG